MKLLTTTKTGTRRRALAAVALVSASILLTACSAEGGSSDDAGSDEPIAIGTAQSLTGDFSVVGVSMRAGAEYAVDQINADGGLLGREVVLTVRDDQSKAEQAVTAFNELAADSAVFLAPGAATTGTALLDPSERQQLPMVSPGTAEGMTEPIRENVFQVPSTGETAGKAMGEYLADSGYERVFGVVNTDDQSLTRGWAAIEASLESAGQSAAGSAEVSTATVDYSAVIAQAKAADADAIAMFLAGPPAVAFAQQAAEAYPEAVVVASNAVAADYFVQGGEASVNGAIVATPLAGIVEDLPDSDLKSRLTAFIDGFTEANGSAPDQFALSGYAAMEVIFAAIEKAGSIEPAAIQDALSNLTIDTVVGPIEYGDDNHGGPGAEYIAMAEIVDNALIADPWSIKRLESLLSS